MALVDTFFTFKFIKLLVTPWNKTEAFKFGIIDEKGKVLRKQKELKNDKEKNSYTHFHRLVWNVKRVIEKAPGGKSKVASYGAALFLLKEMEEKGELEQMINEEAPANVSGNIADNPKILGSKKKKKKKKKFKEFKEGVIAEARKRLKKVKTPAFKNEKSMIAWLKKLGPDDTPADDVMHPLTGEILMSPGESKRALGKLKAKSALADIIDDQPFLYWSSPNDHRSWENDQENEFEEFYNVVYKDFQDKLDQESFDMLIAGDYDVYGRYPAAIARKDRKKFDDQDVKNINSYLEFKSWELANIKLDSYDARIGKKRAVVEFSFI